MVDEPPAAPAGRRRYAKSRETRAQILAAALAEASERGLHKASVAGIAARANAAIGSLHYHFGSRAELLRELMQQVNADLLTGFTADDAGGADFFERYRAGLVAYLQFLRAHPGQVRLADEVRFHDPEMHRRGISAWVAHMADMIRSGIAEGTIRPMDETEIGVQAHFLIGARHFIEELLAADETIGDDRVLDAYLGLVRDGLGSRPDDSTRARGGSDGRHSAAAGEQGPQSRARGNLPGR